MVTAVSAAKPSTCATIQGGTLTDAKDNLIGLGYDQWGYNYQAHMFNGLYDNYSRPANPVTEGNLNLIMKWNDAWLSNKSCDGDNFLDRFYGYTSYIGSGAWLTNHITGTYTSTEKYQGEVKAGEKTVDVTMDGYLQHWFYSANFSQAGTVLTGTLTDSYYPTTGAITGTIDVNHVVFTFVYPDGSIQGTRTYVGDIDSTGNISGTWTQTGSQGGVGNWSISDFANIIYNTCEVSDFVKMVAVPTDSYHDTSVGTPYGEGMWYVSQGGAEIGPTIWGDFAVIQEVSSDPCNEFNAMNYRSQVRPGLGNWQD